jgi:hypothetical protein
MIQYTVTMPTISNKQHCEGMCLLWKNVSVLQVKKKKEINTNYNANILYACNVKIFCTKTWKQQITVLKIWKRKYHCNCINSMSKQEQSKYHCLKNICIPYLIFSVCFIILNQTIFLMLVWWRDVIQHETHSQMSVLHLNGICSKRSWNIECSALQDQSGSNTGYKYNKMHNCEICTSEISFNS